MRLQFEKRQLHRDYKIIIVYILIFHSQFAWKWNPIIKYWIQCTKHILENTEEILNSICWIENFSLIKCNGDTNLIFCSIPNNSTLLNINWDFSKFIKYNFLSNTILKNIRLYFCIICVTMKTYAFINLKLENTYRDIQRHSVKSS